MKTAKSSEKRLTLPVWIATVAGAGYFPVAPGTVGSAVGVGVVATLQTAPLHVAGHAALLIAAIVTIFFLGVWVSGRSEQFFGRTDPGHVVIDEVAGQMTAFLLSPHASWKILLLGFALFRLIDVTKPFPARQTERLPGGWGIMVDDMVAGTYALAALVLLSYLIR